MSVVRDWRQCQVAPSVFPLSHSQLTGESQEVGETRDWTDYCLAHHTLRSLSSTRMNFVSDEVGSC